MAWYQSMEVLFLEVPMKELSTSRSCDAQRSKTMKGKHSETFPWAKQYC